MKEEIVQIPYSEQFPLSVSVIIDATALSQQVSFNSKSSNVYGLEGGEQKLITEEDFINFLNHAKNYTLDTSSNMNAIMLQPVCFNTPAFPVAIWTQTSYKSIELKEIIQTLSAALWKENIKMAFIVIDGTACHREIYRTAKYCRKLSWQTFFKY